MLEVRAIRRWSEYRRGKREVKFLDRLPRLRCRICGNQAVAGQEDWYGHVVPVCDTHAAQSTRLGLRVIWSDELTERVFNHEREEP